MERYQIFISSTYTDLKEERQAVLDSILKLRHIPVGMEQFVATSDEQFEYIKRMIDETDYYILIIGNRYGSLTDDGISYTEKEFDYAVSKDVPILAFVHSSPDSLPVNKSDVTPSTRKQLSQFREKVMDHRLVSSFSWDSPASLAKEVVTALSNAIKDYPRPGWVRVRNIMAGKKSIGVFDPYRSVHLQMMDMEYPFEHERIMSAFASFDGTEAKATIRESISNMMSYGSREYRYPMATITGPFYAIDSLLKESSFLDEAEAMTLLAICGLKVSSKEVSMLVESLQNRYKIKNSITFDFQTVAEWENTFCRIVLICRFFKSRLKPVIPAKLPLMVSFFSLYAVKTASELNVRNRWEKADYTKTLSVPIGIDEDNNPYYWDLHYKGDGPNAIVAGMLGSGKTEFLLSYLISLAINYPPNAVGFILVDYKGSRLIDKLHSVPHYLGGIPDLNDYSVRRLLLGLQAEVEKRKNLLRNAGVESIDEYLALYQTRSVYAHMPHVFIVIDELAEVKRVQPELHSEILSLAQIGRSLGFHVLWGTQRPSGVIDDRVWSWAKTRICMKVVTEFDSQELLKQPDANYITSPGRGYVQKGYQVLSTSLVQFVFGGGRTLFGTEQVDDISTLLHNQSYESQPVPIVLPPLAFDISYPAWTSFTSSSSQNTLPLGVYDDPENQRQGVLYYNYSGSNLLAVGASHTGKTNLLLCLIRGCTEGYSPNDINIFVIGGGRGELSTVEFLPNVGGVISSMDWPRIDYLASYLQKQIDLRKKEFIRVGVSNYASYIALYPKCLPSIILMIDDIIGLEASYSGDIDWLTFLCNYGLTFGISIVATAQYNAPITKTLLSTFATRIVFYCPKKVDYDLFLESTAFPLPNTPGRCLVKTDQTIIECQTYKAFEDETSSAISDYIDKYSQKSYKCLAHEIPSLPPVLDENYVFSHFANDMDEVGKVVIGIRYDSFLPSILSLGEIKLFLLSGRNNSDDVKTFIDYLICATDRAYPKETQWYIADNSDISLFSMKSYPNVVSYGANTSENGLVIKQVESQLLMHVTQHSIVDSKEKLPLLILVINDTADLEQLEKTTIPSFLKPENASKHQKLCVIVSGYGNNSISFRAPSILRRARDLRNAIMFHSISEIKLLDLPYSFIKKYRTRNVLRDDFFFFHDDECEYVMKISFPGINSQIDYKPDA